MLDRHWDIQFSARPGAPSGEELIGLPDDGFVALLTAVRLAYLKKEPANFHRTSRTLRRVLPDGFSEPLEIIKANWKEALGPKGTMFVGTTTAMSLTEAIDSLMNGIVFHQDPRHDDRAHLLAQLSPLSDVSLQLAVFLLGHAMIQLDSLAAHALGETSLPRAPVVVLEPTS